MHDVIVVVGCRCRDNIDQVQSDVETLFAAQLGLLCWYLRGLCELQIQEFIFYLPHT
jgi:hypothetical protein